MQTVTPRISAFKIPNILQLIQPDISRTHFP